MTEAEWEEYIDTKYAQWVALHEAYLFEDNYEPFETRVQSYLMPSNTPKQVNRS